MRFLFLLFILTVTIASCNQEVKGKNGVVYKSAADYNDFIVGRQATIMKNVVEFVDASQDNLDSAEQILDRSITRIDGMISDIREMPPYKGDSALRDAALGSFNFYKKIFSGEYKQLINIRRKGGAGSAEGIAEMRQIVDQITIDEDRYDKAFQNAQQDFAKKNNIRLKENEMQDNKMN